MQSVQRKRISVGRSTSAHHTRRPRPGLSGPASSPSPGSTTTPITRKSWRRGAGRVELTEAGALLGACCLFRSAVALSLRRSPQSPLKGGCFFFLKKHLRNSDKLASHSFLLGPLSRGQNTLFSNSLSKENPRPSVRPRHPAGIVCEALGVVVVVPSSRGDVAGCIAAFICQRVRN